MRVDPSTFDGMYDDANDPWGFATSAYELDRYQTTITSLSRSKYLRCFEPACSIGVLTERLATHADHVVACDGSANAIEQAKRRLAATAGVELVAAAIPEWWPTGQFDLIVLSELGYYWDTAGWGNIIERCRASTSDGAEVIAVHWLGSSPDHVIDGRSVHAELLAHLGPSDLHVEHPDGTSGGFVLDRWSAVRNA